MKASLTKLCLSLTAAAGSLALVAIPEAKSFVTFGFA
jgi:hypothetical protein